MAGYSKNREENYEIKYLQKVLRQVDNRVQTPESLSAGSLRHLLDSVDAPTVREAKPHRMLRLSFQSGIAYAAAFALIVALFYSTKFYYPSMVSGGTDVLALEQQPKAEVMTAEDAGGEIVEAETPDYAGEAPIMLAEPESPEPAAVANEDVLLADEPSGRNDSQAVAPKLGIGGGGKANLLLERDEYAFYWRMNDLSDPDRTSPVSFEVVDKETQAVVTQTDVPLESIMQSLELNGSLIFIGTGLSGDAEIYSYDISSPEAPVMQIEFAQEGELIGANVYKDIVRVVTLSETADSDLDTELLPGCVSSESCVITAFDPASQSLVTKQFTGANGTIQLHSLNAYIRYTGQDDEGETKNYIAQILFDGMDITLGTVS